MRAIKIYNADTKCVKCGIMESRIRAEANDWIEITYVDNTGMAISKSCVCNSCAENWQADVYTPTGSAAPAPGSTVSQVAV